MAKQQGLGSADRVTETALEIYLRTVTVDNTRTHEQRAKEAFEKADAFWLYADARKENK